MRFWPGSRPDALAALSGEQMEAAIRTRLRELESLGFSALCDLPGAAGEEVVVGSRTVSVWTYVDRLMEHEVRVVVQLSTPFAPDSAWSQSSAQGFRRRRDGSTIPVVPPEIYEFD
jgi:hypothetical protein